MSASVSHKIKSRAVANDVVFTPTVVAKDHFEHIKGVIRKCFTQSVEEGGYLFLDPCRNSKDGVYFKTIEDWIYYDAADEWLGGDNWDEIGDIYEDFRNHIDWCEKLEGKDFMDYTVPHPQTHKTLAIIGNPPYSILDKWFEKTISLKPKVFSYLIGVHNLTCKRIEMAEKAGYSLKAMKWFKVQKWYGMSCFATFVLDGGESIVETDRTVYYPDGEEPKKQKKPKKIKLKLKKKKKKKVEVEAKPVEIKKCAICDKRLGFFDGKYEMEVMIENMIDDNFKSYRCCGMCGLDRAKQKNFELVRKKK